MKVRVLKEFRDRNTKELVNAGSFIDVDEKRLKEINSTKHGVLVEKVKEEKKEPKKEKSSKK